MDHDGLFKQLLTNFFFEFVESFLPKVSVYLDVTSIEFLDKETFSGPRGRRRRESDLVVKVRFRDATQAFFLIHIENQSTHDPDFPRRMFHYYIRLVEKYKLPVYPVVIFSYETPRTPAPSVYTESFPDKTVLQFNYTVIQLNRLSWRRFIKQPNPAATALMTRMQIPAGQRPKVKAECMRLISTLKLDPDKAELIYAFLDTYLELTAEENKIYEGELDKFEPDVKETAMEIISRPRREGREEGRVEGREEGREEGRVEGRQEGKEEMLSLILEERFSTLPDDFTRRLDRLTSEELDELGKTLLRFTSLADLERWLDQH